MTGDSFRLKIPAQMASVVIFALVVRYGAAPVTDFTVDDWYFLVAFRESSWAEVLSAGMREIYRPLYFLVLTTAFKLFGDSPSVFSLLRLPLAGFLILLVMVLIRRLAGGKAALVSGLIMGLLPNMSEPFYWHCHGILLYVPILFVASLYGWVRHLQQGGCWCLFFSYLMYAAGVFSYEYGVMLPPLFLVLSWLHGNGMRKAFLFFIPPAAYAAWRLSSGFGVGHAVLADPGYFSAPISLEGMVLCAREIASWWTGRNFAGALVAGWNRYLMLSPKLQAFIAMNLLLAAVIFSWVLSQSDTMELSEGQVNKLSAFSAGWFCLPYVPFLFFMASSRHNMFPAIGLTLIAGIWLSRRQLPLALLIPAFVVFGVAVVGQSLEWRDSGLLHRRVAVHLRTTLPLWRHVDVVLFDTRELRERLMPGILADPRKIHRHGERYGTAPLPREFAYEAMMRDAVGGPPDAKPVLDIECGAVWQEDYLHWHVRFDPSKPRSTLGEQVFVVNVLSVALANLDPKIEGTEQIVLPQ